MKGENKMINLTNFKPIPTPQSERNSAENVRAKVAILPDGTRCENSDRANHQARLEHLQARLEHLQENLEHHQDSGSAESMIIKTIMAKRPTLDLEDTHGWIPNTSIHALTNLANQANTSIGQTNFTRAIRKISTSDDLRNNHPSSCCTVCQLTPPPPSPRKFRPIILESTNTNVVNDTDSNLRNCCSVQ